jgi:phosphate:Na+ symporter
MVVTIATLLGGLGLFMLAVSMITDGLKLAGGDALQQILHRSTSTTLRGIGSGVLVTGLVQSSSAVTVATIGFVNAGFLTLPQALGVVYGANIGTTMTSWLVAAVGFDFKLETVALPLVGLGMLARLLGASSRAGALGQALAGFGLFFIGIDVLRGGFQGVTAQVDVAEFAPEGVIGLALYVVLGIVMTVATQSSSAAIALTLSAASAGTVSIGAGAAMVIGAGIGTTSTAVLAAVGATANARRVAAGHVLFNVLTGSIAFVLLPVMIWLVFTLGGAFGAAAPAAVLALFHTTYKFLGMLLLWPFTGRLADFLSRRFVTASEAIARPVYLDRNVLVAPTLALDALRAELLRASALARGIVAETVSAESASDGSSPAQRQGLRGLLGNIEGFVTGLEANRLPEDLAANVPLVLRVVNYLEDVVSLGDDVDRQRAELAAISRPPVADAIAGFEAAVLEQVARGDADADGFDAAALEAEYEALKRRWHELKSVLLEAAGRGLIPASRLNGALEALRSTLKMAEQLTKAARRISLMTH